MVDDEIGSGTYVAQIADLCEAVGISPNIYIVACDRKYLTRSDSLYGKVCNRFNIRYFPFDTVEADSPVFNVVCCFMDRYHSEIRRMAEYPIGKSLVPNVLLDLPIKQSSGTFHIPVSDTFLEYQREARETFEKIVREGTDKTFF